MTPIPQATWVEYTLCICEGGLYQGLMSLHKTFVGGLFYFFLIFSFHKFLNLPPACAQGSPADMVAREEVPSSLSDWHLQGPSRADKSSFCLRLCDKYTIQVRGQRPQHPFEGPRFQAQSPVLSRKHPSQDDPSLTPLVLSREVQCPLDPFSLPPAIFPFYLPSSLLSISPLQPPQHLEKSPTPHLSLLSPPTTTALSNSNIHEQDIWFLFF